MLEGRSSELLEVHIWIFRMGPTNVAHFGSRNTRPFILFCIVSHGKDLIQCELIVIETCILRPVITKSLSGFICKYLVYPHCEV